jgi:hypothetical protein
MRDFTFNELDKIVNKGRLNELIGKVENEYFECKSEIYDLKKIEDKIELVKDVSSFANLKGGFILIGLRTKRDRNCLGDVVEGFSCIDKNSVDLNQYYNVINDWIYPKIEGLKIEWIMDCSNGKGVLLIRVPPQKDNIKPFLTLKGLDERKKVVRLFGYSLRNLTGKDPLSVEEFYRIIRDGLDKKVILDELEKLKSILEKCCFNEVKDKQELKIENRIKNALYALESYVMPKTKKRIFVLIAYPGGNEVELESYKLKTLFSNENGSIKRKLEYVDINKGRIRNMGWDLFTENEAKIIDGEFIRVINTLKVVDLYQDGMLVFACLADENYLAWPPHITEGLGINPIALIESVYNFISFYGEVITDFEKTPEAIHVRFGFYNLHLNGKRTYLSPNRAVFLGYEKYEAPSDTYLLKEPLRLTIDDFKIERIPRTTYIVVKEIYLWFGIPVEQIPYTEKDENGKWIINIRRAIENR